MEHLPDDNEGFALALIEMRRLREEGKKSFKKTGYKRRSLSKRDRNKILEKTAGRCHICGGEVGKKWQADHVLAYSAGGEHSVDNYLPAHPICNNYRWNYTADEFQVILKLGVWARTQAEKRTAVGKMIGARFLTHERQRIDRRKPVAKI
jgi:HNH endonuclease